jgi:putative ABC transport system permease protein
MKGSSPFKSVLVRLAWSNFVSRKVRTGLTVAAVALAVSLVVAVTSGYASMRAAAFEFLDRYMGGADAQITLRQDHRGGISEALIDELRADGEVRRALGRLETELRLLGPDGEPVEGPPAHVIGVDRPADDRSDYLPVIEGRWFEANTGYEAVVDQEAADALGVGVGDTFVLPAVFGSQESPGRPLPQGDLGVRPEGGESTVGGLTLPQPLPGREGNEETSPRPSPRVLGVGIVGEAVRGVELRVVGIVHKPSMLAAQVRTVYVPLRTLQRHVLPDRPRQVTRIFLDFERGVDVDAFVARWEPRLAERDPLLRLRGARETRRDMDRNLQGMELMSYLGGTISMLAAAFIVFSALSMGVAERVRTLAMLRAVGAERSQVGWLVVAEGMLLAAAGVGIGVPLGWFWVSIIGWWFAELFTAGVVLSWGGLLLGAGGSAVAALLASVLPAWNAMRVSPLEAMGVIAVKAAISVTIWCALLGLVLISLDPLILFLPELMGSTAEWMRDVQFWAHFIIGLPGVMIGFFLLAPLFVLVIERVAGPVVAGMLGIRYALLRQQLSGGIWRSAGTCAALMVGLSVLVVLQTQGRTLLGGWRLPDRFPDIFIVTFQPGGLSVADMQRLEEVPGIRPGEVMPIAIASPQLGTSVFAIAGAAVLQDATMFFGIDPDRAFDMMELEFRQGSVEEAQDMLKKGRHVLVTEEFRVLRGLGVGDSLPIRTMRHGMVDYTIAGVIWSPGFDVMVSMYDMGRQFDQRTVASVFGTLEDAQRDFGVRGLYLFAANLDYGAGEKEQVLENVRRTLGLGGLFAGDVREIKFRIQQGLQQLLLLVSTVAFAAMAVASLGVTNTVMASIRSRRWQLGVLRSIGVTRSQLVRLVLAEAVLLGLVGTALGLAAGLEMAVNARQFSRVLVGYHPDLMIPWGIVGIGVAVVMGISIVASVWPAATVARSEPLALLQAGRASV